VDRWEHVAVLGAAGKMGSGISLLLLQELATRLAKDTSKDFCLTLLDANPQGFTGLLEYLRDHLTKYAERSINHLRSLYSQRQDLIDNSEMIEAFVDESLERVRCASSLDECRGAKLVFEAIIEDIPIKSEVFRKANALLGNETFYFTNTSSIPIHVLQKNSGLEGRLIGYHFYNPPPVQKLLEVIEPKQLNPQLKEMALEIAKKLKKTVVFSNDIAGFIGNGHFIREILEVCRKVHELSLTFSTTEAIYAINRVTQEFLIRPMGTFQLLDYVGLDVGKNISKIMDEYLQEGPFLDPLLDEMLKAGIKGGQHADGSQKDGIFKYEKGQPVAVYDLAKHAYITFSEGTWRAICDQKLGDLPQDHISWKILNKDVNMKVRMIPYFVHLWQQRSLGAELAQAFLIKSRAIAYELVESGVAHSVEDVDTVLKQGFFHLYGVDEPFSAVGEKR